MKSNHSNSLLLLGTSLSLWCCADFGDISPSAIPSADGGAQSAEPTETGGQGGMGSTSDLGGAAPSSGGTVDSHPDPGDCEVGSYDDDADGETACVAWTSCEPGEYVAEEGTTMTDRACAACADESFSNEKNAETCVAWSACEAGTTFEGSGSATADTSCTPCPDGTWDDDADPDTECIAHTSCISGQGPDGTEGATSDVVCQVCAPGSWDDDDDGATACQLCWVGTYCPGSTAPLEECRIEDRLADVDGDPTTPCLGVRWRGTVSGFPPDVELLDAWYETNLERSVIYNGVFTSALPNTEPVIEGLNARPNFDYTANKAFYWNRFDIYCSTDGDSWQTRRTEAGTSVPDCNFQRVFISSEAVPGDIGSLRAADSFCQDLADAQSLDGNWKALLEDDSETHALHLYQSTEAYRQLNGVKIADNYAQLIDSALENAITVTEKGDSTAALSFWGGNATDHCGRWTNSSALATAAVGTVGSTSAGWHSDGSGDCEGSRPVICVEQP